MLTMRVLLTSVAAACLASCASTTMGGAAGAVNSAEVRLDPTPDTVFIYDDGRVERYLEREGEDLIWATRGGREYTRSSNPALPILSWEIGGRVGQRQVFGDMGAMWPPQDGGQTRFRVLTDVSDGDESRRYSQPWSCAVSGPAPIGTSAGEFRAFEITCDRYSLNTMRLLEKRTWWWAEDLGHFVKRRFQSYRTGEVREISLCGALPKWRATEARIEAILDAC